MTSPLEHEIACYPTRIVSGAIHQVDPARTLHAHGKKNEWDVVLRAYRRHLLGKGKDKDNFHFTEAPGMCPVATAVDFTEVRMIAYQCGLPVRGAADGELDVVTIHLGEGHRTFFLSRRAEADALDAAWKAHQGGEPQEHFAFGASVHTGTLYRMTWLVIPFARVKDVVRRDFC